LSARLLLSADSSPNGFGGGQILSLPTTEEQAELAIKKPHCD
jgi:hypothetical protein